MNPFRVKMSLFSPFFPKPVTLKFFIIFCNINIKHVKFYIYFALVSLYSKGKNKNADKPSLFLKQKEYPPPSCAVHWKTPVSPD